MVSYLRMFCRKKSLSRRKSVSVLTTLEGICGYKKGKLSGIQAKELCFILFLLCIYQEVKTYKVYMHNIATKLVLRI